MSIKVDVNVTGLTADDLARLEASMQNREELHAAIASGEESLIKRTGPIIAASQHHTADTLGGKRTGHLEQAYQSIEVISDANGANMLIPGDTRLAAAFGEVHIEPGPDKKLLTIAVSAEAYGHRAGEFDDLFFVRLGPENKKRLYLAKEDGEHLQTMYLLVPEATVPQDETLLPFVEMDEVAQLSAEGWIDELLETELRRIA